MCVCACATILNWILKGFFKSNALFEKFDDG